MSDKPKDAVSAAFDAMRKTAGRRGVKLPDLSFQGSNPTPRRSAYKPFGSGRNTHRGDEEEVRIPGFDLKENGEKSSSNKPDQPQGMSGADGRRRRSSYDLPRLGEVVRKEVTQRGWVKQLASGWVLGNWEELVGKQNAKHTKVTHIKGQTVYVQCSSTAWAWNLRYMQSTILAEIAKKIGPNVITKLEFSGPKAPDWRKGPLHVKGRGPRDTYG